MENILSLVRRNKNIKQRDMANALGVTPSYLCKIERGTQEPSQAIMKACSEYLGISLTELFPRKADKKKNETMNHTLHNKLWGVRNDKGIKQNELAQQLGCSPSYLSKVEKGLQQPTNKFKKKCAKILKIKEIELFSS